MRAFADSNGDGIGDFNGLTSRLDYLADLGVTAIWLLPFYPSPLRDDGYDIADYRTVHPDYGDLRQFRRLPRRGPRPQHPGDHRARRQPHVRPAPVVPAGPPRPGRVAGARLLRVERPPRPLRRRPHHLLRLRDVELDVGPGRRGLLLAPLLLPPARPQLRQPRRRGRRDRHARLLARHGRRRPAPRRRAVPPRARGHELREPARDPRGAQAAAQAHGRPLPGPHAAGRGQPVAGGRRVVLRRRRRVPHELPLPGDAAAVHGPAPGAPHADRRHHGADAGAAARAASGRRSCATTTS